MSEGIQIAFPATRTGSDLLVPTAPDTPVNAGMSKELTTRPVGEVKKMLSCSALLQGETLAHAQHEADELYPKMVGSTAIFMAYGTEALSGVNDLIERLLHDVEPAKIPELTSLMRELNAGMRGIQKKYDVSDPKVRDKYEHWKGGVMRFLGQGKTMLQMLMEDVTSIESQLTKVSDTLTNKQYEMLRNVTYYDELYKLNEEEIGKVIYAIGVMELIRDKAQTAARNTTVGNANLGDRGGEQAATLVEFANNMDIKIAEYKGRLFVAWATSPQVRMMRTLDVGLAERINELTNVTVPTMKATIVQWRLLMETKDAAEMSQEVQEASNKWLTAYAAAGAQAVPMIADAVQTPTLQPATVEAMANSIAAQADAMIAAVHEGAQRRAALDAALMKGKSVIDGSTKKITDDYVQTYVDEATQPLEIATSVTQ